MAHRNPNISKTVFFKNPKFIGGINESEIQDGEKITADCRNFRKEP
jgi:hypothetical protein